MGRINILIKTVFVCGFISLLIGCAQIQAPTRSTPEKYNAEIRFEKYSKEIDRLETIVLKDSDFSKRMQAYFQLAQLYISYKNPKRNYQKALENLEVYLSSNPAFADNYDLRNWLSVLKEIERLSKKVNSQQKKITQLGDRLDKSKQANVAFKKANKILKESNTKLKDSNMKLTKTIEMLKSLDRHVEEKRKNYSNQ
jgi:tetratricopeptide (TPR) repeat protein